MQIKLDKKIVLLSALGVLSVGLILQKFGSVNKKESATSTVQKPMQAKPKSFAAAPMKFKVVKPNLALRPEQKNIQSKLGQYFGNSDLGLVAQYKMLYGKNYCQTQASCPANLFQLYSFIGQQMPVENNESRLGSLIQQIKESDLPKEDKQELFSQFLPRFISSKKADKDNFKAKGGMVNIEPDSLLIIVTLNNYLLQSPKLDDALEMLGKSLQYTKDSYVVASTMSILAKSYPQDVVTIYKYFSARGFIQDQS